MSLLAPSALWLLTAAIPIIVLYMLKLRRRQVPVSSTLLWTRLLMDREANSPWQRLKRNLLLFLQLLILISIVLAAARPAMRTQVVATGAVILLLDASASMNAADVSGTRFDAARRAVQELINGLGPDSKMTLVLVGSSPVVIATADGDKGNLAAALKKARPTQGSADWAAAFALAAGASHGSPHTTTVIVSDGGLPGSGLPVLAGEVRFVTIGRSDKNVAISALALRATADTPELFAEVTNYGSGARSVLLSFYLNDALLDARQIDLPAGQHRSLTLDRLSTVSGVYRAHISEVNGGPLDALPLDDTAFAVYQSAASRRVLLVSKGNIFLEQLLSSLPGIQPFRTLPGPDGIPQIPTDRFDLYVLDGIYTDMFMKGNLLFVNPPANPYFTVGDPLKTLTHVKLNESDLTHYVDWTNIHVLQAESVLAPDWANVLVQADQGPLVFAGERSGQRIASVNFDLHNSDLPVQVAFPILFSNLINYLVPPAPFDATESLRAGQSISITTPADTTQVLVAGPSGEVLSFQPPPPKIAFSNTAELGYYAVNFVHGNTTPTVEYFAVNLFDPAESDIRPRTSIVIGHTKVSNAAAAQAGQLQLWQWPAVLALLLLLVEWQAYHRRSIRMPRPLLRGRMPVQ